MEIYTKFELSSDLQVAGSLYCEKLVDDGLGLTLLLRDSKSERILSINFEYVYSFLKTNESYRLKTLIAIPDDQYLILKVENSKFLSWLHTESKGIYIQHDIHHFMIITDNEVIDILSNKNPTVQGIDN